MGYLYILPCESATVRVNAPTSMRSIGLIREGKVPADNRVPLTPAQCKWLHKNAPGINIVVQSSNSRCFKDQEYEHAGIEVRDDISSCDILLGIKEVPVGQLIEGKTYLFFSHTKKKQPQNKSLLQEILRKKITLIDYECLEHDDGQAPEGPEAPATATAAQGDEA